MKVLVTGGHGLVGRHLEEICPSWTYLSRYHSDLREKHDVERIMRVLDPDFVVHLAADVGGIQYNIKNQPELLSNNTLINTNVLTEATHNGTQVIAMLSTCIYPESTKNYPMDEELINQGKPQQSNLGYALSKRLMYEHIQLLNQKYNAGHICLVPSNLYGYEGGGDNAHFVSSLINKLRYAKIDQLSSIDLWGDGTPLRQFTYAGDIADIIRRLITRRVWAGTYNCATPENLTIKEIAEIAKEEIYPECEIEWDPDKPNGQFRKDVRSDKLNACLSYMYPYTKLREGIRKVVQHHNQFDL